MATICDELQVWENWYKPINNHIADPNDETTLFETYGEELEFVNEQPSNKVWTWVDGADGTYVIAGKHFVYRIGYFITEEPWADSNMVIPYEKYDK